jgi:cytidine deaminase
MKEIVIRSTFTIYDSINELPLEEKSLMEQAIEIRRNAYAPYSKFKVGSAILLSNGKVVLGSNQENAAYPSGLCAERVAIFQAGALYPEATILQMALSAASDVKETRKPIPPCGACRQSISEYEMKQDSGIVIFFMGNTGEVYRTESVKNLLPLSFDKNLL